VGTGADGDVDDEAVAADEPARRVEDGDDRRRVVERERRHHLKRQPPAAAGEHAAVAAPLEAQASTPSRPTRGRSSPASRRPREQQILAEPCHDRVDAFARAEIREHERPRAALFLRVALHDAEIRPDVGREVDLVDDEEV